MIRIFVILVALLILVGCGSDTNLDPDIFSCDSGNDAIIGCWLTDCGQMLDQNQNPISLWGTQKVSFRNSGEIQLLSNHYDNSACTGSPIDTTFADNFIVNYLLGTQTTDSNGVSAKQINFTIINNVETNSLDALYHITSDPMLCTSESVTIDHLSFGFSYVDSENIDLTNCLIRAE